MDGTTTGADKLKEDGGSHHTVGSWLDTAKENVGGPKAQQKSLRWARVGAVQSHMAHGQRGLSWALGDMKPNGLILPKGIQE